MKVVIDSQGVAIALGIGALAVAMWAFDQAWEARGQTRPRLARWLGV